MNNIKKLIFSLFFLPICTVQLAADSGQDKSCFIPISKECESIGNSYHEFNPPTIGHLTKLSVNGVEIEADIRVRDPRNLDNKSNVVALIEYLGWEGQPSDRIDMQCKITPKFKGHFMESLYGSNGNPKIEAELVIYEYDHHEKKYFRCFYTEKPLVSAIANNTNFYMRQDKRSDQTSFIFTLSLAPHKDYEEQKLFIEARANGKVFSFPFVVDKD